MTKIVERVARALCKDAGYDPDDCHGISPLWMSFRHRAIVAIAAMRDPTIEMTDERGDAEFWFGGECVRECRITRVDAVLCG